METKDYLQDIREIKNMMSQSTQFISLSGLSGVLAGIYALIGAYMAGRILPQPEDRYFETHNTQETVNSLILIAMALMVLSIGTAYIMTIRKAKRIGESVWNMSAKRLLVNFAIPLATGGIFSLLLLLQTDYKLVAPVTLIFYGLACVNASKYTLRDVRYLGLTMVVLGLISVAFPDYGLYFWALGFGFCHILYGAVMHFKYDRK